MPAKVELDGIVIDRDRCVVCGACSAVCPTQALIVEGLSLVAVPERCRPCGQAAIVCPTGALVDKKSRGKGRSCDMTKVRTTCPYCGTGCNFFLNVRDNHVIKVTSDLDAPVNKGNLCIKGRYGYDFIHSSERVTAPIIKKGDKYVEASWDEALDLIAKRFGAILKKSGPTSIGAFSSARCSNEENYLLAKLVRTVFKSNNVDCCARV